MEEEQQKDGSWFEDEPCHMLNDRLAVGHAERPHGHVVFVAADVNGEVQVFGLTPDRADQMAKELRRSAGAARALNELHEQEDADE